MATYDCEKLLAEILKLYEDMIGTTISGSGSSESIEADDLTITTKQGTSGSGEVIYEKYNHLKWLYDIYKQNGCNESLLPPLPPEPLTAKPKWQTAKIKYFTKGWS